MSYLISYYDYIILGRGVTTLLYHNIQFVDDAGTLHCKFDNGRTLGVIPDVDKFHKIAQEQSQIDKQTEENIECEEITETEDLEENEEMNMSM